LKVVDIHSELKILILQATANDRKAQKVLYQKYAPKLLSVCRQYLPDMHMAEDMLVTTFMKIFTNLEKFESKGQFEAWIRRIAVNECISFIRASKKVRYAEEKEILTFADSVDERLYTADIQEMIDNLPYGCKMVFNLYAVEGYKHHEIATMLQISEGTSKSQLAYARKLLRQMLEPENKIQHG
jgi:RNA polymerase sigma-70 factor, ECF subfamily